MKTKARFYSSPLSMTTCISVNMARAMCWWMVKARKWSNLFLLYLRCKSQNREVMKKFLFFALAVLMMACFSPFLMESVAAKRQSRQVEVTSSSAMDSVKGLLPRPGVVTKVVDGMSRISGTQEFGGWRESLR